MAKDSVPQPAPVAYSHSDISYKEDDSGARPACSCGWRGAYVVPGGGALLRARDEWRRHAVEKYQAQEAEA